MLKNQYQPTVQMVAIAMGTVVGERGIIHVDPNHSQARNRAPLVSEADATLLEKRKLAVRENGIDAICAEILAREPGAHQLDARPQITPFSADAVPDKTLDLADAADTGEADASTEPAGADGAAVAPPAVDPDAPPVPARKSAIGKGAGANA